MILGFAFWINTLFPPEFCQWSLSPGDSEVRCCEDRHRNSFRIILCDLIYYCVPVIFQDSKSHTSLHTGLSKCNKPALGHVLRLFDHLHPSPILLMPLSQELLFVATFLAASSALSGTSMCLPTTPDLRHNNHLLKEQNCAVAPNAHKLSHCRCFSGHHRLKKMRDCVHPRVMLQQDSSLRFHQPYCDLSQHVSLMIFISCIPSALSKQMH